MKEISVIIPCHNEKETISRVIFSVDNELKSVSLDYEIIVVDNGSSDGSADLAKRNGAIVIYSTDNSVAGVRNKGVGLSKGNILIFLDGDVTVDAGWGLALYNLLRNQAKNRKFIAGSHPSVPVDVHSVLSSWYEGISKDTRNTHLGTGHMIVSREVFDSLNGFDSKLISGEDYDFCHRAKINRIDVMTIPELVVFHYGYPNNIYEFIKREIWHGMGDCASIKRFINSKVAISGLINNVFLITLLFFFFINIKLSFLLLILILILNIVVTIFKFGLCDIRNLLNRTLVSFFYLIGRGISPFVLIFNKICYCPSKNRKIP